jgi:hypothetical protein
MNIVIDKVEEALDAIDREVILNRFSSMVMMLFLPIDIDMQALAILTDKKENNEPAKDPDEYLCNMLKEKIDYLGKKKQFQEKIDALHKSNIMNMERLNTFYSTVEPFLNIMQDLLQNQTNNKRKKPSYSVIRDYWEKMTKYKSFHKWYIDLGKYFRQANNNSN